MLYLMRTLLLTRSKGHHAIHGKDNKIAGQVLEMHKIDRQPQASCLLISMEYGCHAPHK